MFIFKPRNILTINLITIKENGKDEEKTDVNRKKFSNIFTVESNWNTLCSNHYKLCEIKVPGNIHGTGSTSRNQVGFNTECSDCVDLYNDRKSWWAIEGKNEGFANFSWTVCQTAPISTRF